MEDFGQKSALLVKNSAYCILYWNEFCNYAQKRRICRQNSKYAPVKNLCGHFCRRREAANYCHPGSNKQKKQTKAYWHRCAVCVVCAGRKGVGYKCEHAGLPRIRWSFQPSLRFVCSASVISHARHQTAKESQSWNGNELLCWDNVLKSKWNSTGLITWRSLLLLHFTFFDNVILIQCGLWTWQCPFLAPKRKWLELLRNVDWESCFQKVLKMGATEGQSDIILASPSHHMTIPDICQFWGTTTPSRPVKGAPKSASN